ncbi:MAG: histidine phosphatase family protein [Rhodospirillaceae bacterium]|nr:histidine phosphatase family protein [Rhodospirillales bacterium]
MRIALLLLLLLAAPAMADEAAWRALAEPGTVGLMRHAEAPGTLDPEGFQLEDCATQRLLDHTGRAQARAMGEAIRRHGIAVARVYTSQWCRCRETAELLALAPVEPLPALNSLLWAKADKPAQLAKVRRLMADARREKVLMVTHQFNIGELTGQGVASGEIVVVRPEAGGGFTVLGRILPP